MFAIILFEEEMILGRSNTAMKQELVGVSSLSFKKVFWVFSCVVFFQPARLGEISAIARTRKR